MRSPENGLSGWCCILPSHLTLSGLVKCSRITAFFQPPKSFVVRNQDRTCPEWIIRPFETCKVEEGIYPGGNRSCPTVYETVRKTLNAKTDSIKYSLERMMSQPHIGPNWLYTGTTYEHTHWGNGWGESNCGRNKGYLEIVVFEYM